MLRRTRVATAVELQGIRLLRDRAALEGSRCRTENGLSYERKVVSRLGLEPRALALKAPPLVRKINVMIHLNRPMSDKHLQGVTIRLSYIGQPYVGL